MSKIFTFYPDKDDQKSSYNCTDFQHVSLSNISFHFKKKKKKKDISISRVLLAERGMGKCPSVSLWRGKVIVGEEAGGNEVMTVVVETVSGRVRIRSSTGECEPADRADR